MSGRRPIEVRPVLHSKTVDPIKLKRTLTNRPKM